MIQKVHTTCGKYRTTARTIGGNEERGGKSRVYDCGSSEIAATGGREVETFSSEVEGPTAEGE
jgi:hypothetical protein